MSSELYPSRVQLDFTVAQAELLRECLFTQAEQDGGLRNKDPLAPRAGPRGPEQHQAAADSRGTGMMTQNVRMRTFATGRSGTEVSRSTSYTFAPCDDPDI